MVCPLPTEKGREGGREGGEKEKERERERIKINHMTSVIFKITSPLHHHLQACRQKLVRVGRRRAVALSRECQRESASHQPLSAGTAHPFHPECVCEHVTL